MSVERSFAARAPRNRLWPASLLEKVPERPRDWLMENHIPAGAVSMLGGDGGVGKSQIALQLAVATVTGTPFLERPVKRGSVVFIAAEDDQDELRRRLIPICAEAGVTFRDLSDLHILTTIGEDALLAVPEAGSNAMRATPLMDDLGAEAREVAPVLIVIDTLADVFGGSEFDRGHVRSFVTRLRGAFCHSGAAVLLLAHPSLAGMRDGRAASGSTAWTNSVRSALTLKRDEKTGLRTLTVAKSNYGPTGLDTHLRWREGAFALAAQGDVPKKFRHQSKKNKAEADAKASRLSGVLPVDLSVDTILPVLERQGFLDRTDPKNRRRTARYWIEQVEKYRNRKSDRKGDADGA